MVVSCCCPEQGLFFLLLLAAAVSSGGSSDVKLNVEALFHVGSPCLIPQEHKHGAATGTRMPVVHRHGPCSPLADEHGKAPSHEEILAADQRRVEYIRRRVAETTTGHHVRRPKLQPEPASLSSSAAPANVPASSGDAVGTGNYVVTIGLGTPEERLTVVFDTGSDTTWVQCQPCVESCYMQEEPLFSPANSSTYANVSCSSPYCSDLDRRGCSGGHCLYAVRYGDGSTTVGFYAQDTLTLASDAVKADMCCVQEFRFGCGEDNRGLFGRAAGLMGLGRGKTSLTSQARDKYGGVFSYCLPATPSGTGFLDLGPAAGSPAANARFTPMLTDMGPTFYYVGLTGIKVDGRALSIPGSVFSDAGALVDSGTVITRLPPKAYAPLRSAFAKAMEGLGYKKAPATSFLDTCYDLTEAGAKGGKALPAVSLAFQGGASLDVDKSGILYQVDESRACLAFAPNSEDTDMAIVGNTQQKTYGVLYDLGKKVVGFAPGAC